MMLTLLMCALLLFVLVKPNRMEDAETSSPSLHAVQVEADNSAIQEVYPHQEVRIHYPKRKVPSAPKAHRAPRLQVVLPSAEQTTKKEIQSWLEAVREVDDFRKTVYRKEVV